MYGKAALYAKSIGAAVMENAPMKNYTSFKTGGSARMLVSPVSADCLCSLIAYLGKNSVPFTVIGNGTNLLVQDSGYDGVVVKIGSELSKTELIDETTVFCEAGASMKSLCMFAMEHSLSGLEFAYGIPGTLGGAVYMNAGAYGGEMKDVLLSCNHIDNEGKQGSLSGAELDLGYRHSAYSDNGFAVVSAVLALKKGDKDKIKAEMNENLGKRKSKQPLEYPSAGSTFKRPEGYFAGALIEGAGLKGFSVGGAQVSEKHAGFVINKDKATSSDIMLLIKHIQETVYEKYGVMLEPEVKILESR